MTRTTTTPAATPAAPTDGLVTIKEACRWTSVSRSSIYALMRNGELASAKVGGRRLIPRAALAALVERNLVPASA